MNTCYTIITNNYDSLKEPTVVSKGWEYVCLSDRMRTSETWKVHLIEGDNRDYKIRPYNVLFEGITLYVDGSMQIIGDLNELIEEVPTWFSIWKHPHRNCTYKEAKAVVSLKNQNKGLVDQQMQRYKDEGFPGNWGLGANGIMIRDTSDRGVRRICEEWWIEYGKGASRDQLSLMYCFWKRAVKPHLFRDFIMQKYFIWGAHL